MKLSLPPNKVTLLVGKRVSDPPEVTVALTVTHERAGEWPHLVDEHLRPPGTHE